MADEKLRPPEQVAKLVLLDTLRYLEEHSYCRFCVAGHDPDLCGVDDNHVKTCPLFGYDMTPDLEHLKAWAEGAE